MPLIDCGGQIHVVLALVVDVICQDISSFPPHCAEKEFGVQFDKLDNIVHGEVDLLVGLSFP